jgi:arylsulfatase A-like enzyme
MEKKDDSFNSNLNFIAMKDAFKNTEVCYVLIFLILVVFSVSCQDKTAESDSESKPNILFIMSDDHTSQAVSAYGGMLAQVCPTPNIDRLAKEGILFSNCFVTNSICSPSRATIMTGKYSHKNGVYKFTALDQSQPTLPKAMKSNGYQTAFYGKYHLHSNPEGIDHFSILPGQGGYHDPVFIQKGDEHPSGWVQQGKRTEFQGHSSDAIADQALDYLRNKRASNKPFMLFCQFKAPHDTWEYAERYEDFLADVEIPEPSNLFDDYEGRSDALKKQLQYIGSEWGHHTNFPEETANLEGKQKKKMQYQLYMKKYLRCVKGVDDNVGRILDYLDESGLAENTVVIYTSDQGFFLGEHGLYDKRFMYEESLRMPFLLRWPGKVEHGTTSDGIILNVDFASTILDMAGLEPLEGAQGVSFLPLIEGNIPDNWRKSMYYRYYFSHFDTEPHIGVRTADQKLIHYDRIDQWELYDLISDPQEMNNLYEDPGYSELIMELKNEMIRLQTELQDDPEDDGSRPNIGPLEGRPLYQSDDISLSDGDISLLIRFKTDVGGTFFSTCRIGNVPWAEEFEEDGFKTLFLRAGNLFFNDEEYEDEGSVVMRGLDDNQWHTIAFIVRDNYPSIYLDGDLKFTTSKPISENNPNHTFNIGAGVDFGGYNGYNFIGNLDHVMVYGESLKEESIQAYATGVIPEGQKLLDLGSQDLKR